MAKKTEKMPDKNKTVNIVIPSDVKSVTITFDATTGMPIEATVPKPRGRKICD